MSDFYVTVGGDRAALFERVSERVFGSARVPVRSPVPVLPDLPGRPREPVYLPDLEAVTPDQVGRLVRHVAERFGLSRDEVVRDLARDGMPIVAEGCSVTILRPQRWTG